METERSTPEASFPLSPARTALTTIPLTCGTRRSAAPCVSYPCCQACGPCPWRGRSIERSRLKRGKAKDRHRKANRQNLPKLWAFSHLGGATCRFTQVTVVHDRPYAPRKTARRHGDLVRMSAR